MSQIEQQRLYIKLGLKIKEARERVGLNQGAFAQMLNLSRPSVVNIEKGRQRASVYLLYQIARITKCGIHEFLPATNRIFDTEPLKDSWKNKISKSAKGNLETKEKLTKFLKEVTTEDGSDENIPKQN